MSLSPEDMRLIGGSDAAVVAGVSRWRSPLDVWLRIVEGRQAEQTPAMRRGHLLEPVIREMYRDETGAVLLGPESIRRDFARASLDDRTEERVVELKSASLRMAHEWGEPGTDDVPTEYLCQVQWYMRLSGRRLADLAVLLGGDELRIYPLAADAELQEMLWEAAARFHRDYVSTRRPPPVDGSESSAAWIQSRFPKDNGTALQATPEVEAIVREYREAAAQAAVAAERRDAAKNRLKEIMGEAKRLEGDGWRISWGHVKGRETTDWKAVCAAAGVPESIIQQHTQRKAGFRQFRPSWAKEQADE